MIVDNSGYELIHTLQINNKNDTLKNYFINKRNFFSITIESIFQVLNNFVCANSIIYNGFKILRVFKNSFNFYLMQGSKIGLIINILDLMLESDINGGNINIKDLIKYL